MVYEPLELIMLRCLFVIVLLAGCSSKAKTRHDGNEPSPAINQSPLGNGSPYDPTFNNNPGSNNYNQPQPSSVTGTTIPNYSPAYTANGSQGQSVDCYKADAQVCDTERLITSMTNMVRQQFGLRPLTHNPQLSYVARLWSLEQANARDISHNGFPQARMQAFRQEFGNNLRIGMNSENVAMSYLGRAFTAETIAREFVGMWSTSPGHFANMIGSGTSLGVGVVQSRDGGFYATQIFAD